MEFPAVVSGEREKRPSFGGALPRFRQYRIGMVHVTAAGPHSLTLSPAGDKGRGLRVSSFTLTPVR